MKFLLRTLSYTWPSTSESTWESNPRVYQRSYSIVCKRHLCLKWHSGYLLYFFPANLIFSENYSFFWKISFPVTPVIFFDRFYIFLCNSSFYNSSFHLILSKLDLCFFQLSVLTKFTRCISQLSVTVTKYQPIWKKGLFWFQCMISWPHCFGPGAAQTIKVGAHGGGGFSLNGGQAGKERGKGLRSHSPPCSLTSFHWFPFFKGSTISQQCQGWWWSL